MSMGEIIKRMQWMAKVKDCSHVCLFCEYYDMCKDELQTEEDEQNEHEICNEK